METILSIDWGRHRSWNYPGLTNLLITSLTMRMVMVVPPHTHVTLLHTTHVNLTVVKPTQINAHQRLQRQTYMNLCIVHFCSKCLRLRKIT